MAGTRAVNTVHFVVFLQVLWEDGEGGGYSRGGDSGGDREQQGWPVW